jgi:hypothetical protein
MPELLFIVLYTEAVSNQPSLDFFRVVLQQNIDQAHKDPRTNKPNTRSLTLHAVSWRWKKWGWGLVYATRK